MNKLWAAVKSTAGELVVAALVAGMVYLSVQMFNQGEIAQDVAAAPATTDNCTSEQHATACQPAPASTLALPTAPDAQAPLYVTVTVAE